MNEIIFSNVLNDPPIKGKLLFDIIVLLMHFRLHIFQKPLVMSSTATPFVLNDELYSNAYFEGL